MREILFRGKRKDNGEWCEGFYTCVANLHYIATGIFDSLTNGIINTRAYKVDPETVGQYTGLTDKNGRRIFEGDIILYRQIPCVVNYNAKTAHYSLYLYGKIEISGFNHDTMKLANIIGNIYDNPELLEV